MLAEGSRVRRIRRPLRECRSMRQDEENERFPYNFSAVWDELAVQIANNG